MKKLLILLAALSLVACSSNKPKEQMIETPMATEIMVEDAAVKEATMAEEKAMEDAAMAKEKAMEDAATSYIVVDGDNLFQIGLKYNMSWDKLTELNNISNPDVILVGQKLMIPTK